MGRPLGHAAAAATRTEAAALAREGDHPIQAARLAPEPGEASSQTPAREERAELIFNEAGQSLSLAQARRLGAKCLEVVAHQLVQRLALGLARPIGRRRRSHRR
jgi:hypothetical protein